jgi:heterodisulfide reductase subunit C
MKKELVLVKDINDYWTCALCFTCTEDKHVTDENEAIQIIRDTYSPLSNAQFVREGNDIFALVEIPLTPINIKEGCSE